MGGKGSNQVSQTTSPPPQVMQQYQNVSNAANSAASNPYYWYPGQLVAGMSPEQTGAIGETSNIASALENPANSYGMAQPFINSASQLTLAGSQPITAGQINQYMNPYLQQVGQTTLAEINQNNAMQQQQLMGNAAAAGALGGNRVGLAQAALANQQDLAANATLANINAQGFNTALGAAQTTAGQQLQGGFLMGQTGQTAENAALSGLNAGLTGAQAQYGMGTAEQQQQQNQLNAAYGQWLGQVQYPFQNTNFLAGVQSGLGSLSGGTGTTTYPSPSPISQLAGLGLVGAGIAGSLGWAPLAAAKKGGRIERAAGGLTLDVQPQSEVNADPGYIGPTIQIAHGPGAPNAPAGQNPDTSLIPGFSSIPDVMKFIGGLKGQNETAGTLGGSRLGKQSGGVAEVPTPLSQQILDYQEMGQLYPGSPVRTIQYQPPKGLYSRGGLAELRERRATGGPSTTPAMQGMEGISSLPLTGQFNVLNKPGAGTYQPTSAPGMWGNVAMPTSAPQAGNLAIPQTSTGANFAPITYPGGASSGPVTSPSGIPNDYFSAIQAAAPHPGWNAGAAMAPAAPASTAPVSSGLPADLQAWLQDQYNNAQATSEQDKRGGRVPRAGGGSLGDVQTFPLAPAPELAGVPLPDNSAPVPRGIRNNNPLNLEYVKGQQGLDPSDPTDGTYGRYGTMQDGIAQSTRQLKLDYSRGADTVAKVVNGWATTAPPPVKASYINNVSNWMGVNPNQPLNMNDPKTLASLQSAMARQETGRTLNPTVVAQGVQQGLGNMNTPGEATANMIAQNGQPPGGLGDLTDNTESRAPGVPIPPISAYPQIQRAADVAAQRVPQVPVPTTTPFENYAESPWAAVTAAGLGMLSGTSPFAAVNIGRGGLEGLNYMQTMLPQERARQELQAHYQQQNAANVLTGRGQAIQGVQPLVQTQGQGLTGAQVLPGTTGPSGYNISPVGVGVPKTYGTDPQTGQPLLPPVLGLPEQTFSQRYSALSQMTASRSPQASAAQAELGRMTGYLSQGFYPTEGGAATFARPRAGNAPGTQAQTFTPENATGMVPPVSVPEQTVTAPNGQTETYPNALAQARQAINSPWGYERQAGATWMAQYGPQVAQGEINGLTSTANTLANQKEQLSTLQAAADKFVTGPTANTRMAFDKAAATIADLFHIPAPQINENATAAQIIPKVSAFILSANARAASDMGGAQAMQLVEQATPGLANTREGIQKLVSLYDVLADRQQAMSSYVTNAVQSGQMTYNYAVQSFNQSYPPEMWASRVDPIPLPVKDGKVDMQSVRPGFGYVTPKGVGVTWTGKNFVTLGD